VLFSERAISKAWSRVILKTSEPAGELTCACENKGLIAKVVIAKILKIRLFISLSFKLFML